MKKFLNSDKVRKKRGLAMKKLFIVLCAALTVAGCGKRGRLDFPPNAAYPRQYPAPRNPVVEKQSDAKRETPPATLLELNEQLTKETP